jgi:hypothetical protein
MVAVTKHQLAFWDAMLWASVQRAGTRHLLSEDFQDGIRIGTGRIRKSFRAIERCVDRSNLACLSITHELTLSAAASDDNARC